MSNEAPILCEIDAATGVPAADFEQAVKFCARQLGLRTNIVARDGAPATVITLHLLPGQAAPNHPVWCLVCHLACLCPQARVGALVHASGVFTAARSRGARSA